MRLAGGKRTVVEVRDELHREIRKLALLNDLRIYELTNAIIEETLKDKKKSRARGDCYEQSKWHDSNSNRPFQIPSAATEY